jgi:CDP-glucose 4,6-dehydratase
MLDLSFYRGKRILVTGHTGFKGAWLCHILTSAGAIVTGYSLDPPTQPNLFTICRADRHINSVVGDIRDYKCMLSVFSQVNPEIVIHMAAQPLVSESYQDPVYTYETNVMGTVNVLECIRQVGTVKSFLNVTTDKVYQNNEWEWGYRETDPLDGFDPYSNSKSCSELVTHSYKNSFFPDNSCAISTARAGNVIGGGDFAKNRIIPDCVRAAETNTPIIVRNPRSIRPYQHVLEPLFFYLLIVQKQYEDYSFAGYYNIGPEESDSITTEQIVDYFCQAFGNGLTWESRSVGQFHEAHVLKLDCSRIRNIFGWHPRWNIQQAVEKTVDWTKVYLQKGNIISLMDEQILQYISIAK